MSHLEPDRRRAKRRACDRHFAWWLAVMFALTFALGIVAGVYLVK